MYSTRRLLRDLEFANPFNSVTEEQIRRAIRDGLIEAPCTVAGRFVWTDAEVDALARALGVNPPDRSESKPGGY
jgi:hypothetical protein